MELIFIFTIILCEICLVNFFEVVKVVRTFGIDAFMDNEVFPVLFGNQGVAAMKDIAALRKRTCFHQEKIQHHRFYTGIVLWNRYSGRGRVWEHHSVGRCRNLECHTLTGG